jgi:glutamate/tyrosine decarboxylase-like PLP-dependent enzyme
MRDLGYRTVDRLVSHLGDPRAHRLLGAEETREALEGRLLEPAPESGEGFDALLDQLWADVIEHAARGEHPGYFAFIPSCHTWIGALGDLIAAGTNMYAGSWMEGAGPTQLELTVLDWFRSWLGLPDTTSGVLVSGGSAANMTALACARESLLGAMNDRVVAYVGDQAHSSLARAARALGFRPDQVRVLPCGDDLRLSAGVLARAIAIDRASGRQPLFVAASGGATNTGVVDPLASLAEVCHRENVWLHVDAAYGGFAALTDRGRAELTDIELADSVTLDPHKWLYQPFECGALLVRDADLLRRAFEVSPDYLHDTETSAREVNLSDRGFQLSRMSHAVKVWLTVRFFGLAAIRGAIDRSLDLAEYAERRIRDEAGLELLHGRALSIVCFRRRSAGADEASLGNINAELVAHLARGGEALVSSTRLKGRYAVRLCVLNHTSQQQDVDHVIDHFARAQVGSPSPGPRHRDRLGPSDRWLGREPPELAALRTVPLLAVLDRERLERVAATAHEQRVPAGAAIVARWESGRDVYVLLEGEASVLTRHVVTTLRAGDFFGELAALDWGAGYGYARLATVKASTDVRLLVVPYLEFSQLMSEEPGFEAIVRAAVQERLPGVGDD